LFDLTTLSRPLRRVLAEWIGKLVDRLLHFRDQLRHGVIRMISTTVAETIEDQFYRPPDNTPAHCGIYDEDADGYDDHLAPWAPPLRELAGRTSPAQAPHPSRNKGSWRGVFSHAASILLRWVQGPWAEPLLASVVTLISLLLVVR
jgi:hypothetical protein